MGTTTIAMVYAGLGETDLAFEWLDKAYERKESQLTSLAISPWTVPLRDDPRFEALLRRINYPMDR